MTVLDYPINHVPDPTKNEDQNLNLSRETIARTRILLYTENGLGHVISFTRDATTANKISIQIGNGSTLDNTNEDINAGIEGINTHLLRGVDSDGNLNSFADKTPLFAIVERAGDMTLLTNNDSGDGVTSMQVKRNGTSTEPNNTLFVIRPVELGAATPTGYNQSSSISTYNINKITGAVSKINDMLIRCPILIPDNNVFLGYVGKPSQYRINTVLDTSELVEDRANLSLIENLGIEPPPRGVEDDPLTVDGFTRFDPEEFTFPSSIDIALTSTYSAIASGGGESTRGPRAYERLTYDSDVAVPIRIIIRGKTNQDRKVVREYMASLTDEAITQTSRDDCRTKGTFIKRQECSRRTTTNVRQGLNIDLSTYYSDNVNSHDVEIAIGIRDENGNTVYRQLPGTLSKANRRLVTPNFIDYSNPLDLTETATHDETFNANIGNEYTAAAQAVTESCRLRYCYTYYSSTRNLESAPSKLTPEIAVSRNDPVEIKGFIIPTDPQVTDIRLYRICPELGETAFTLIEELPITDENGAPLPDIAATDELTRADLGDLTYNDDRELVFREITTPATDTTPAVTVDRVIVNANGTRADIQGFNEQYESYANATGRILDSWDHLPPPSINDEHINHLLLVRGTLVGIIGSRIYWSVAGFPDYWPAENFIDFDEKVTGTHPVSDGLLVFTQNSTHLLTNFPDPARLVNTLITNEQGCVNPRTPKDLRSIPIWVSNDGVCTYSNGRVLVVSRGLLGDDYLDGEIITTEVHNDVYYILYNNRIMSMDQRYLNQLPSGESSINTNFVEYDTNGVRWIEKFDGEDILYGVTDENKVVEMFGSNEELDMSYISPIITIVGESRIKQFEDLYIAYRNASNLTFVARFFGLSAEFVEEPYELPVGEVVRETKFSGAEYFGVQFVVKGKGEISSIDFTVELSDQPRSDNQ